MEILISSLILSLIIILPLSTKWRIPIKISMPTTVLIGIFAGFIVIGIERIYFLRFVHSLILQVFLISGIFVSFLVWRFYRNPERIPTKDVNTILSPADGKVIYVKKYENGEVPYSEKKGKKFFLNDFIQSDILPKNGYIIGIAQNFLDVHVNRAPMDGHVALIRHIKGRFLSLKREEALILNERALTVFDNGKFRVGVIQIASRLVRQIVVYFTKGQNVKRGERFGMIRFGSQVDLILPTSPLIHLEVKPGNVVKAGLSIVAKLMSNKKDM